MISDFGSISRNPWTPLPGPINEVLDDLYGPGNYTLFEPHCGDNASDAIPDGAPTVVLVVPSPGDLISVQETDVSFVARLPADMLEKLSECDLFAEIVPLPAE